MFIDIGKEYRSKVNEFNAGSFYGASQAKIQEKQQERTEVRSQGGLNETAEEESHWKIDNPHTSVIGQQAFLQSTSLWNTKFKEKEVNLIQYKQPPSVGYNKNRWIGHLEEIEAKRVAIVPSFHGNGAMVLVEDYNA